MPLVLAAVEVAALLLGGAVAAGARRDRRPVRPAGPLAAARPARPRACSPSRSASASTSSPTRSAPASIRFTGPSPPAFTVFWIVGMINSINWIDGLDGLSSGIALIAAVTLGVISLTHARSASRSIAVLCFALAGALLGFLRWNFHPASIFTGTSGVQFVGYTLAVLSILGTAKVAVALLVLGVPIIDTFWIIVRRLSQGRSPFSPDRATSTTGCSTSGCRTARRSSSSTASASSWRSSSMLLSGVTQLYAFLGVFVVFGLVLFLPTRGDFDRPDELEAEAYEPTRHGRRDGRPVSARSGRPSRTTGASIAPDHRPGERSCSRSAVPMDLSHIVLVIAAVAVVVVGARDRRCLASASSAARRGPRCPPRAPTGRRATSPSDRSRHHRGRPRRSHRRRGARSGAASSRRRRSPSAIGVAARRRPGADLAAAASAAAARGCRVDGRAWPATRRVGPDAASAAVAPHQCRAMTAVAPVFAARLVRDAGIALIACRRRLVAFFAWPARRLERRRRPSGGLRASPASRLGPDVRAERRRRRRSGAGGRRHRAPPSPTPTATSPPTPTPVAHARADSRADAEPRRRHAGADAPTAAAAPTRRPTPGPHAAADPEADAQSRRRSRRPSRHPSRPRSPRPRPRWSPRSRVSASCDDPGSRSVHGDRELAARPTRWDFDDGAGSTPGGRPTHSTAPASYTVILTVTGPATPRRFRQVPSMFPADRAPPPRWPRPSSPLLLVGLLPPPRSRPRPDRRRRPRRRCPSTQPATTIDVLAGDSGATLTVESSHGPGARHGRRRRRRL